MKLELQKYPHYWINLDEHVENAKAITEQFDALGFQHTRITGIRETPYLMGCGKAHVRALQHALAQNVFPCCIYEDDATTSQFYTSEMEIPDNADAVYLGISLAGRPTFERFNDHVSRVRNMMSLHAVCYVTKKYAYAAMKRCEQCLYETNIPHDVGTAMLMGQFNVYACNRPQFFQSDDRDSSNKWQGYTDQPIS